MSLLINYFPCPRCEQKTRVKHRETFTNKSELWFGCRNDDCRHHWKVLVVEGMEPKIVAESNPRDPQTRPYMGDVKDGGMGCPRCGRYGSVKATERRTDNATVRRHKCPTDGYYFSCTDADGNVEITKLRPNMKVRDAA